MPSANFDKVCKRCNSRKHVNEFRRNNKVNVICNKCMESYGKKLCPRCNENKHIGYFMRNSTKCQVCNKCNEESIDKTSDMFKIGFKSMNKLSKRVNKCIHQ